MRNVTFNKMAVGEHFGRLRRRFVYGWLLILLGPAAIFGPYLYLWSTAGGRFPSENSYDAHMLVVFGIALVIGLVGLYLVRTPRGLWPLVAILYLAAMGFLLFYWSLEWCPGDCLP